MRAQISTINAEAEAIAEMFTNGSLTSACESCNPSLPLCPCCRRRSMHVGEGSWQGRCSTCLGLDA